MATPLASARPSTAEPESPREGGGRRQSMSGAIEGGMGRGRRGSIPTCGWGEESEEGAEPQRDYLAISSAASSAVGRLGRRGELVATPDQRAAKASTGGAAATAAGAPYAGGLTASGSAASLASADVATGTQRAAAGRRRQSVDATALADALSRAAQRDERSSSALEAPHASDASATPPPAAPLSAAVAAPSSRRSPPVPPRRRANLECDAACAPTGAGEGSSSRSTDERLLALLEGTRARLAVESREAKEEADPSDSWREAMLRERETRAGVEEHRRASCLTPAALAAAAAAAAEANAAAVAARLSRSPSLVMDSPFMRAANVNATPPLIPTAQQDRTSPPPPPPQQPPQQPPLAGQQMRLRSTTPSPPPQRQLTPPPRTPPTPPQPPSSWLRARAPPPDAPPAVSPPAIAPQRDRTSSVDMCGVAPPLPVGVTPQRDRMGVNAPASGASGGGASGVDASGESGGAAARAPAAGCRGSNRRGSNRIPRGKQADAMAKPGAPDRLQDVDPLDEAAAGSERAAVRGAPARRMSC